MNGAAEPAESIVTPPLPRAKPRAAPSAWAINVMLVDDDPADSSLVIDALKRHPRVGGALSYGDPERALSSLASGKRCPDLILLDISMPKTDGFAFLRAMEEMPSVRNTPVVLLTTSRFKRDVDHARGTIACGYIVKPDNFEELRRRLDAVVKQTISGKWS